MMAAYDEMYGEAAEAGESGPRGVYRTLKGWMDAHSADFFDARRRQAELFFRRIGITFAVGGEAEAAERLIPFDIVPRILSGEEWRRLETGLVQRANVLNAFLNDIYGPGECVRAGIIPAELVYQNNQYRVEMRRIRPPHGVFAHICGTDLVRTSEDDFFVLEDNARTPSGVSYMLENREVMMRLFPELFASHRVAPVETYTDALLSCLGLGGRGPHGGDPDPGPLQLGLLRALLPGRQDGRRARGGRGPVRGPGPCLYAHHRGPAARGRDLQAGRRRLPRSPGVPARQPDRRSRSHDRL
jgi:uncharacterized circularly permuted ATP-grasp superfamily protein